MNLMKPPMTDSANLEALWKGFVKLGSSPFFFNYFSAQTSFLLLLFCFLLPILPYFFSPSDFSLPLLVLLFSLYNALIQVTAGRYYKLKCCALLSVL